jgi:hypothetical protein
MIDVRAAIDEVKLQAEDEAYWSALEKILGNVTAKTLRRTLGAKTRGDTSTERERVSRRLSELLAGPSRFVEGVAKTEASVRGPRPREDALQALGVHEHWIDFAGPSEQAGRTIPFVERGLARGAKVVALLPSERADDYGQELARSGREDDLKAGRLAILAADHHTDILRTTGVLAVVLLAIQGFIQAARGQGYQEIWFVSKIAPSVLSPATASLDVILRLEAAFDGMIRSYPITVLCPFPATLPGDRVTFSDLVHAHTWASVEDEALDVRTVSL